MTSTGRAVSGDEAASGADGFDEGALRDRARGVFGLGSTGLATVSTEASGLADSVLFCILSLSSVSVSIKGGSCYGAALADQAQMDGPNGKIDEINMKPESGRGQAGRMPHRAVVPSHSLGEPEREQAGRERGHDWKEDVGPEQRRRLLDRQEEAYTRCHQTRAAPKD